jgi:hypothetical protein
MSAASDDRHFYLEANDNGDSVTIDRLSDGRFTIEIEEPWAGDSETGFGRTCSVAVSREQLMEMHAWIGRIIGSHEDVT